MNNGHRSVLVLSALQGEGEPSSPSKLGGGSGLSRLLSVHGAQTAGTCFGLMPSFGFLYFLEHWIWSTRLQLGNCELWVLGLICATLLETIQSLVLCFLSLLSISGKM